MGTILLDLFDITSCLIQMKVFTQDWKYNVGNALRMMLDDYERLAKRFSGKESL